MNWPTRCSLVQQNSLSPTSAKTKSQEPRVRGRAVILGCSQPCARVCAHRAEMLHGARAVLENKRQEEGAEGGAESPSSQGALVTRGRGCPQTVPSYKGPCLRDQRVTGESLATIIQIEAAALFLLEGDSGAVSVFWGSCWAACRLFVPGTSLLRGCECGCTCLKVSGDWSSVTSHLRPRPSSASWVFLG